jgi:hypothetical protein
MGRLGDGQEPIELFGGDEVKGRFAEVARQGEPLGEYLATKIDEGEDATVLHGVGLEAPLDTNGLGVRSGQNRDEHGEGGDEREHVEATTLARAGVAEGPAVARILEVAKHLLDLHAFGVEPIYLARGEIVDGGREHPRLERALLITVIRGARASLLDGFADDDAKRSALTRRVIGRVAPGTSRLMFGGLGEASRRGRRASPRLQVGGPPQSNNEVEPTRRARVKERGTELGVDDEDG